MIEKFVWWVKCRYAAWRATQIWMQEWCDLHPHATEKEIAEARRWPRKMFYG